MGKKLFGDFVFGTTKHGPTGSGRPLRDYKICLFTWFSGFAALYSGFAIWSGHSEPALFAFG